MATASYDGVKDVLAGARRRWLVTGAAGFIGCNITRQLLALGQDVVGLDNFSTGHRENLHGLESLSGSFSFIEGDIRDPKVCVEACKGVDLVLHQAALGSVPRSIDDPATSHEVNVDGFINMLQGLRAAGVRRMVYASSSSVYGDHEALPKREEVVGEPLSPYAATKRVDEIYARAFCEVYGMSILGLRYFNVFGPFQDPNGAYAAVIPRWIQASVDGQTCDIFGDGETTRDFCYVDNAVQANLLAAMTEGVQGHEVFNVACGQQTSLRQLHDSIWELVIASGFGSEVAAPRFQPERPGDVRHSLADVSKARRMLGYEATHSLAAGLEETVRWFTKRQQR